MSEFEIRIPARKKQPATDKDNPVVKVSTVAYNGDSKQRGMRKNVQTEV